MKIKINLQRPCPAPFQHERSNECSKHSCHHNPCSRSVHCSHHTPCNASCSHKDTCRCHTAQNTNPSLRALTAPLSTARLKPTRQRTKNAICSILELGEVCMEFIRMRNGAERIVDVCQISGDGMRVRIVFSNTNFANLMY